MKESKLIHIENVSEQKLSEYKKNEGKKKETKRKKKRSHSIAHSETLHLFNSEYASRLCQDLRTMRGTSRQF